MLRRQPGDKLDWNGGVCSGWWSEPPSEWGLRAKRQLHAPPPRPCPRPGGDWEQSWSTGSAARTPAAPRTTVVTVHVTHSTPSCWPWGAGTQGRLH